MPVTGQILIPLSNGADVPGLVHIEQFESIAGHIRNTRTLYDDFNDNSINGALWTEVDSGTNITEVNQRIEGNGNESWNVNGLISKTAFTKTAGQSIVFPSVTPPVNNKHIGVFGLIGSTALSISAPGIGLWLLSDGKFYLYGDSSQINTGFTYVGGKTYNIRFEYKKINNGWAIYVQSPDDSNYSSEIAILVSNSEYGVGTTLYPQMNLLQVTTGNTYLDNATNQLYPASVSPAAVWKSTGANKIKWSTARVVVYKNGVIQAATSTDWKCQKAINNGAYNGTWLTLSALRALSDDTITDATNSVEVLSQYNSDTTYEVKTNMFMVVDVEYPSGGGGGGRAYIN